MRAHPHPQEPLVVARCASALAWQVLRLKAVDELGDGRRVALGLDLGQRIAPGIDLAAEFARSGPRRRDGPARKLTDGEAAVAPTPAVVIQNEASHAPRRDAHGEPACLGVVADRVAAWRCRDTL